MSTHNILSHDKIRKFPYKIFLNIYLLDLSEEFLETQK